jgi:putative (di)nucleoside polyphosphate hydrolase
MKFLGKSSEINVKTKNPEFFEWKWIELSQLASIAVHFKVDIYRKIKEELTSLRLN